MMKGFFGNRFVFFAFIVSIQINADQLFINRYAVIQNFLKQYSRPFTLIEIDPSADRTFSAAIARDYTSTCLIFGSHNYTGLAQWCAQQNLDNILIGFQSDAQPFFERMTECEHFDVIVVPEVHDAPKKIDALLFDLYTKLGDHTVIECVCDQGAATPQELTINNKKLNLLANISRENGQKSAFYYSYNPRRELARRRWGARPSDSRFYHIIATFESKTFAKRKVKKPIPWHHGINLNTFAKLHGVYPTKEQVVQHIRSFEGVAHGDLALYNMVIQGKNILLIDWDRIKILEPSIEKIVAKFLRVVDSHRV